RREDEGEPGGAEAKQAMTLGEALVDAVTQAPAARKIVLAPCPRVIGEDRCGCRDGDDRPDPGSGIRRRIYQGPGRGAEEGWGQREDEVDAGPDREADLAHRPREPGKARRFGSPGVRKRVAVQEQGKADGRERESREGQDRAQVARVRLREEERAGQDVDAG